MSIAVDIPPLTSPSACHDAVGLVVEAVAAGEIGASAGERLIAMIETRRKSFDSLERDATFDDRRADLEYKRLLAKYPPRRAPPEDKLHWHAFYVELHELDLTPNQITKYWITYNDLLGPSVSARLVAENKAEREAADNDGEGDGDGDDDDDD